MGDSRQLPGKWKSGQQAVRAVQVAFDLGEEVQDSIRREALDHSVTPTDRIRQILGLPVSKKPLRPRLSISLSPDDFDVLAERFGVDPEDRLAIRQLAAEALVRHVRGAD